MKFDTIKNLTISELYQNAIDLKKEAMNMRILSASGQQTNMNRMRDIRKDVARIKTRINQLKKSA
ncbi:MAG: 50S ribosomal protein L29 [Candidatus Paracaedibacteraceae bacterium]|nr:50S ribosomal protein L29 [Candidatus Paracaedibacteraceae bacterium]